ncbi:CPBP family intramembrane metalloprotease [Aminipila butyrica]|uniref:CPBP family intramembrane metalloprotease n=1 Tax=Aminipila butyrica TaxID=433296 RepID=A0A858BUE3_9FIRM|nr:CPBP family intramembrane glutamic endopeptidase [Aminipila butyrica]QIB69197.1 CPBP family intramembrane metalloprotease [Aminipila butyrica]
MGFTDAIWQPGYGIKSTLKIITFLFVPFYYGGVNKNIKLKSLFVFRRKGMIHGILMGAGVYAFILACYFTIGTFFNFSRVTEALNENMGVTRENFVFVAIYISFVNSLLEEFFFRGFVFTNLKRLGGRKSAYWISATAFGLYHIAMMRGWFSFWLFILLLMALVGAGIFFNWLNEKQENIYNSWFVHMSANFSINTVGFILFGIL